MRHYLKDAVQAGSVRQVRARVRGPVLDFPYAQAQTPGEFAIDGQFEQVTFDSVPGSAWPRYTDGEGRLVIEGQRLQLLQTRARMGQTGSGRFALEDIEGGIDDLARAPTLRLSGHGHGATADVLQYLRDSPLDGWLNHAFKPARGDGQARLALQVSVPLLKADDTTVQGRVDLTDSTLQMRPDTPALQALHARLDFTERTFSLTQGRAEVAGGPLRFEGGLDEAGVLRFAGQGHATAAGLRTLDTVEPVARLAHQFEGEADYRLQLDLTADGPVVQVDTDLVGMASALPYPLHKRAAPAMPLRVRVQPERANATALQIDAGLPNAPVLAARLLLGEGTTGVRGGWIRLGAADARDGLDEGLSVSIGLPRLSLDDWQAWLQRARQAGHLPVTTSTTTTATTGVADAPGDLSDRLQKIRLRVDDLVLHGHRLTGVDAMLQRQPPSQPQTAVPAPPPWSGTVKADQLAGRLTLTPGSPQTAPALQAHLGRLRLPWPDVAPVGHGLTRQESPAEPLPSLDVVVEHLEYDGRLLGRLELQGAPSRAVRLPETATREWRLHQLTLTRPEARLSAVGRWDPADRDSVGDGTSRVTFRLDLHDAGQWVEQLGWPGALQGGHGHIGGQLHWPGPPTALALAQLDGALKLDLDNGQLLRADPGAGRLLGVLNLQSLPRRLSLDFRDLYQKGFSFDHVDGDVQVRGGRAHTRNLRVRGVQAMVLAEGSVNLTQATQDVRVWVVPDFNAGAASLAYAVINPAVGLGTLVTQWLLQRPLTEAATREYLVTGPWSAPHIAPVDRARDAHPLPDSAEAASLDAPDFPALPNASPRKERAP